MGRIMREVDHGVRAVADTEVRITELIWDDGARSFEVHDADTGDDLTPEACFDQPPTDEQIRTLLPPAPQAWTCPGGCGTTLRASDADLIVGHVRDCDRVDGAGNPIGSS